MEIHTWVKTYKCCGLGLHTIVWKGGLPKVVCLCWMELYGVRVWGKRDHAHARFGDLGNQISFNVLMSNK